MKDTKTPISLLFSTYFRASI